jgi:group I intron endonuclease
MLLKKNTLNGNLCIGFSVDLGRRFKQYYNAYRLLTGLEKRPISNALLKYGYSNFSLEILEYCDLYDTIQREQYFIDLLKPQYNILQVEGSSLGYLHSADTKKK